MKLSEAIRLGQCLRPSGIDRSWFIFDEESGAPCGGCAVGRALLTCGYQPEHQWADFQRMRDFTETRWPWTRDVVVPPLDTIASKNAKEWENPRRDSVLHAISDLYEHDKWTLPQIADWVASVEPPDTDVTAVMPEQEEQEPVAHGV